MPAPTNTTPETAIDLTAVLPYAATLTDLVDVPNGDPAYTPGCESDLRHALWWKITPPAWVTALGIRIAAATIPSDLYPVLSVWSGVPPALTQINEQLCLLGGSIDNTIITQINVVPGETYYFLFTDGGGVDDPGSDLEISFEVAPSDTASAGTFVVSNDTSGFPTAFIDRNTGAILRIMGWPAFEMSELLPNGTLGIVAERLLDAMADRIEIRDAQLQLVHTVQGGTLPATFDPISPLSSDGVDTFYLLLNDGMGNPSIYQIGADGAVGSTIWNILSALQPNAQPPSGVAISPDETIAYFLYKTTLGTRGLRIGRWDLINDVALSQLNVTLLVNENVGRDLLLIDGFLYAVYQGPGGTADHFIRKYDATTGVIVTTFGPFTSFGSVPRITRDFVSGQIVLMHWPDGVDEGDNTYMRMIRTSDMTQVGAAVQTLLKQAFETGEPMYGPSQSCPLIVLLNEVVPPEPPAAGIIRTTQLPLGVAYDYETLRSSIVGNGRLWLTPPPSQE